MKIKCFIVDDESHAIEVLEEYILHVPEFELTGKFKNAVEALQQVNTVKPDFVFLDIDMPRLNGMDFCELITSNTKVVFTTASPDFAIQAFEKRIFDYLLKPITLERFHKCVSRMIGDIVTPNIAANVQEDFFYIKGENKNKMIKINHADINYIESNDNYVVINLPHMKHEAYLTLTEIAQKLPDRIFYRVNKSFIINYHKINYINGNHVILTDKSIIPIGNTYKEKFVDFINKSAIKTKR